MARGPLTDEGRLGIANGWRRRKGKPELTLEEFLRQKPVAGVTGKAKPEEDFVPGRFVAAPGPHKLIPTEVSFLIGRTVGDWASFLSLWKREYEQFRLNSAQAFEDQHTQMKVVLSPIPTEVAGESNGSQEAKS